MKLRELQKLRKQNDRVKIALLFILSGMLSLGLSVHYGISCVQIVNDRTEYVLSGAAEITRADIDLLNSLSDIRCVSRELTESVTIKYQGQETVISGVLVSEEYIEELYGVEKRGGGQVFYMNPAAFLRMEEEMGLSAFPAAGQETWELAVTYLPDGQEGGRYRTATLVVLPDSLHGDEPFICSCDLGAKLSYGTASVRVIRAKQQIEDMTGAQFEKMGFQVEKKEKLVETNYKVQLLLVKLQYSMLLAVVCLWAGFLLFTSTAKIKFWIV
ncbi:MAG: hypothetical protein NC124_09945 [Clostridium sp.]|nr:hypothetical protein [Clostridium sp.]